MNSRGVCIMVHLTIHDSIKRQSLDQKRHFYMLFFFSSIQMLHSCSYEGKLGLQNSGIKNSQLRGKKHEIILKEIMSFIYNVHCYLTFKSNLSQAHSLNVGTHIKLSYAAVEIKRLSNVHCSEWWKTCTLKNNCDVLPWDRKQTYNRITLKIKPESSTE